MKFIITEKDLVRHFKEVPTLVEYSRDALGHKNGVVVAIGAERIGWSKVSPEDVTHEHSIKLGSIPAWMKFEQQFLDLMASDVTGQTLKLFNKYQSMEKAMKSLLKEAWREVPDFSRFQGLKMAINMAIACHGDKAPYSLQGICDNIFDRSRAYFK